MTIRRLIIVLCLNIIFSNLAWAFDACGLPADIGIQHVTTADPNSSDDEHDNYQCDTYCVGWAHLFYVSFPSPLVGPDHRYFAIAYKSSNYLSLPGEPPKAPPEA